MRFRLITSRGLMLPLLDKLQLEGQTAEVHLLNRNYNQLRSSRFLGASLYGGLGSQTVMVVDTDDSRTRAFAGPTVGVSRASLQPEAPFDEDDIYILGWNEDGKFLNGMWALSVDAEYLFPGDKGPRMPWGMGELVVPLSPDKALIRTLEDSRRANRLWFHGSNQVTFRIDPESRKVKQVSRGFEGSSLTYLSLLGPDYSDFLESRGQRDDRNHTLMGGTSIGFRAYAPWLQHDFSNLSMYEPGTKLGEWWVQQGRAAPYLDGLVGTAIFMGDDPVEAEGEALRSSVSDESDLVIRPDLGEYLYEKYRGVVGMIPGTIQLGRGGVMAAAIPPPSQDTDATEDQGATDAPSEGSS